MINTGAFLVSLALIVHSSRRRVEMLTNGKFKLVIMIVMSGEVVSERGD